jgi:hypothetical protein
MEKVKDIVAKVGEYQKDGETKARTIRIGSVFKRDDGSACLKLDSVPIGPEFSGWANLYDPRPIEGRAQPQEQPNPAPMHTGGSHPGVSAGSGEIPF